MLTNLFFIALFVFCMILFSMNHGKKKKKVLFFGDTFNELDGQPGGYISWIAQHLKNEGIEEKYTLLTALQPGQKIYDLYMQLEEKVLKQEPRLLVLYAGVHDVWDKYVKGTGTGLETFEQLFTGILQKCGAANIKVIVCTPVGWVKPGFETQLTSEVDEYAAVMRSVAATYEASVADWNALLVEDTFMPQEPLSRGVTASKMAGDEVWGILSKK